MGVVQLEDQVLFTKAACRRLGLSRADVDRMFDQVPLVTPPGSRSVYVTRTTLQDWVERWTVNAPGRKVA